MNLDLVKYRKRLNILKNDRLYTKKRIRELMEKKLKYEELQGDIEKARAVVQIVAKTVQQVLEYKISDLSSKALEAVMDDDIKLSLEFIPKRGASEAVLNFTQNGDMIDPLEASGYGLVDISAFVLRVSLWSITLPKTSPIFIFDEPFKFLSKNFHNAMYAFIKEVSKRLNIQIIMVTHETDFIKNADRQFAVERINKISHVEQIDQVSKK